MSTRAYQGMGTAATPQNEAIPGSGQVPNSAGGFAWAVDCWERLNRFLILGTEGGTYYIGERPLTRENADALLECLNTDGPRTVRTIIEISASGRAAKNTPAIFALAVAAASTDKETQRLALDAIPAVCRTGTHLFQFANLVTDWRGWGRSLRRGIGAWYTQDPGRLAYQIIKYRQREGWTHRDMLRKCHVAREVSAGNPTSDAVTDLHARLYDWICHRENQPMMDDGLPAIAHGDTDAERTIESFERAMRATTPEATAALIREYGGALPHEALNPDHKNADVWRAMVEVGMPMTALIRQLATLTRNGVIAPLGDYTRIIARQITDPQRLSRARVHPYAILLASATYGAGGYGGMSRGATYTPVSEIQEALEAAFYESFGNVEPTGKRIMLALDVSSSMSQPILGSVDRHGHAQGVSLMASEGSAAMAMVTRKREDRCMTVTFSTGPDSWMVSTNSSASRAWRRFGGRYGVEEFDLRASRSLRDVTEAAARRTFGGTDASLPMQYATAKEIEVDAFVVYTDNETWDGDMHPAQALNKYNQKMSRSAALVVVGMCSNGFSIADPNSQRMLDVVGFDTAAPNLISSFIGA
jgi:60 kDa SS-A/Ro ribonucleoprotein